MAVNETDACNAPAIINYLENIQTCQLSTTLLLTQSYYMLVVAVFTILFLSLFVHRKRLRPLCCQGRPGVLQPINLLDDIHRRWMYIVCFVILTQSILKQMIYPYNWNNGKDAEFNLKFSWISVIIQMILMFHNCIIYYPLFTCVAHRKYVIANVVGILYVIPLLVVECIMLSKCPPSVARFTLSTILWNVLTFVLHAIYLFGSIFELVSNIRTRKDIITTSFSGVCSEHEHHMVYVRHLLNRKRMPSAAGNMPSPSTTVGSWKQYVLRFLRRLNYEIVPGFRYSTAVLSATFVSISIICLTVIASSHLADFLYQNLYKQILFSCIQKTLEKFSEESFYTTFHNFMQTIDDYVYITRVVFHVANVASGALQLALCGHMIVRYRRNVLLMYRGNHDWHHKLTLSPANMMVGAMNYPSYQITYNILGWLVSLLLLFILVFLFAVLIIVPIRDHQVNHFMIQKIIFIWPTVVIFIAIGLAHYFLCRLALLQNPSTLAIENRRLYFVTSYFTFLINIFIGIFSVLRRLFVSVLLGAFLIGRLDYVLMMRGFEQLDGAHETYLSLLTVEVTQNHPIMRAFIELLRRATSLPCTDGTNTHTADVVLQRQTVKKSQRLRNRWFKLVTIVNNPSIIDDKLNQRYREMIIRGRQCQDNQADRDISNGNSSKDPRMTATTLRYHHLNDEHICENVRY